jgi:hypothetical protein
MSLRVPPFNAAGNAVTVSMTVGTVPQSVQFDNVTPPSVNSPPNVSPQPAIAQKSRNVRVFNAGPDTVFIELGGASGPSASKTSGVPLAPNAKEVFTTGGATFLSAVALSSAATIYATPGEGGI